MNQSKPMTMTPAQLGVLPQSYGGLYGGAMAKGLPAPSNAYFQAAALNALNIDQFSPQPAQPTPVQNPIIAKPPQKGLWGKFKALLPENKLKSALVIVVSVAGVIAGGGLTSFALKKVMMPRG